MSKHIGKKILLIVEDDESMRKALTDVFSREKINVLETGDGQVGLMMALEKHPDLVLLDVMVPSMNGITILQNLRKDDWGKKAKVILLTNLSSMDTIAKAIELGSYEYILKTDISVEEIVEKVKGLLSK